MKIQNNNNNNNNNNNEKNQEFVDLGLNFYIEDIKLTDSLDEEEERKMFLHETDIGGILK